MTCQLSVDHRVIDGALAAEWLQEFKAIVEEPLSLML
jgi:pyruvate dehydrogenase E2 component (dihydrolipoamide acetyltransferase)